jgi:hypothetical protein
MAGKRRARNWALIALALVSPVALSLDGGSNRSPGNPEGQPEVRECTERNCEGTMRLENGEYVCDENGDHRMPAGQTASQ